MAMVKTFDLLAFKYNDFTKKYVPELPLTPDSFIHEVIDYVTYEAAKYIFNLNHKLDDLKRIHSRFVPAAEKNITMFQETCFRITYCFIAKHFISALSTCKVGKNWNSVKASVGASVCQLAVILAELHGASKRQLVNVNFPNVILQANIEMRSKHEHPYVLYVEYMASAMDPQQIIGGEQLYLGLVTLLRDNHDRRVHEIFYEKLARINSPAPQSTHAHTFDFNLMSWGVGLLDSKCKLTSNANHESVLVFHSADQTAFKDTASSILTTNTSFKFFSSTKNTDIDKISMTVCEI